MVKIYLAAPWADKQYARLIGNMFEKEGIHITEKWWEHPETDDIPELIRQAVVDWDSVVESDAFVLLNTAKSEGKATEMGMALQAGLPVFMLGQKGPKSGNIFHNLPKVTACRDISQLISTVKAWAAR